MGRFNKAHKTNHSHIVSPASLPFHDWIHVVFAIYHVSVSRRNALCVGNDLDARNREHNIIWIPELAVK